jgi:hypothetical protein
MSVAPLGEMGVRLNSTSVFELVLDLWHNPRLLSLAAGRGERQE